MTKEKKGWADYIKGGYHPVRPHWGVTFQPFSWRRMTSASSDLFPWPLLKLPNPRMNRHTSLKFVKSTPRYTENALDEIKLLRRLITSSTPPFPSTLTQLNPTPSHTHPGRLRVISFLDNFRHKAYHSSLRSPRFQTRECPHLRRRCWINYPARARQISVKSCVPTYQARRCSAIKILRGALNWYIVSHLLRVRCWTNRHLGWVRLMEREVNWAQ